MTTKLISKRHIEIAVVMTCHNRRAGTVECIRSVYNAQVSCKQEIHVDIYLTDDGSSDGTGAEISHLFPEVILTRGDGSLYWAGGMIKSWKEACRKPYDGYLLLNDDTVLLQQAFDEILRTDSHCKRMNHSGGVYVGGVKDPDTNEDTYGGSILRNRFLFTSEILKPNGEVQECHLGNGNVMFVSNAVVEGIGIFSRRYKHGIADYDYTLRARRAGFAVLLCADHCGVCKRDHFPDDYTKSTLKQRIGMVNRPRGMETGPYLYFMYRFFPYRLPLVLMGTLTRILAPKGMNWFNKSVKR
ncbi:MAG: glycosyltransferase [Bacteroidota bacterium]